MSNNNNKKHNYERKARSSRFTPKIREYLAEIANERETELERFMMLSSASPASSGVSVGAPCPQHDITANNNSSCRVLAEAGEAAAVQIVNIPIVMVNKQQEKQQENVEEEEEEEEEQQLLLPPPPTKVKSSCSVSVEDLRTPTKDTHTQTHTQPQMHTRKTQTPESALKSHKRLEWDPAADVGYHRSMGSNNSCERAMSTSNISTLERSVLEAAMQPLQATQRANQSETDLKRLQLEKERVEKPPLASSTFVQRAPRSTPVSSSRRDSCVTSSAASSFDYQPNLSRPSTAGTGRSQSRSQSQSQSSRRSSSSYQQLQQEQQSQSLNDAELKRQEREYAAQLEQKLSQRRRQHNKENQEPSVSTSATSASSACSSLPLRSSSGFKNDVDLGIDLLCALVNKRSLSSGQKKQLARDIIKRLVGLDLVCSSSGGGGGGSKSSTHARSQRSKEQAQQTEHHENPVKDNSHRQDVATNTSRSLQPEQQQQPKQQQLLSLPVPAPRTRLATPTNEQQMEPCSYASTSSAASNELLTQKINVQRANQESDEQAAVQEWLNPMTQSEIEYEQRQLQRQRQQRNNLSLERRTQIDWIEGEIRRLYALQELLHRGGRGGSEEQVKQSSSREAEQQELEQQSAEKEGKTTLPVPAPPAPPVTPVSMPATNVVAGEDKATTTAAARTATSRTSTADKLVRIEPRARKTSETVEKVIQIEAAADVTLAVPATIAAVAIENRATTVARQQQRSKMATPQLSHSGSSESVCSFVQQRQRQFLAHYQNQQQQRREQQQQQLFRRHQQQQRLFYEQHPSHAACHLHPPTTHCHRHHQHHPPHYVQMQYAQATASNESGAIYYQVVNSQEVQRATATTKPTAAAAGVATVAAAAAGAATVERSSNTSSSLLCLSSEMSIPMGMATACEATTTTTTTTTTTHQYDDVACQQLQLQQQLQRQRRHHTVKQLELQQQQQLLQVRPRGIAYVLQFNSHTNDDDDDAVGQILTETLTVQDYLQRARPEFCAKSKQRKAILNEMQLLRNARRRELDELIEGHSVETIDRRLQQLPPPVTAKVRIFSTREMKAMTNKRCENLPEVLAAQQREREERRRRSNRIMRDVFNRRLQRRVRSGKLSLNHSRTVI